jgi:hypothetical protein
MDERRFVRILGALGFFVILGSACGEVRQPGLAAFFLPRAAGGTCGTVYLEGIEDSFKLGADLSTPGSSPQVVLDAFVPGSPGNQILLTRSLVLTLPADFGFQGFDALGAGAQVATWDFDFSNPGNGIFDPFGSPSDYRIPIFAIDADHAYADSLLNGSYDAGIDPEVIHSVGTSGEQVFTLELPSGGTNNNGDANNPCSYFSTDTRFTLASGIVTLPSSAGGYALGVDATSVDPDTGDADDMQGTPPVSYQRSFPITVPEPAAALAGAAALAALLALRSRRPR